jgi:hypothetical protein
MEGVDTLTEVLEFYFDLLDEKDEILNCSLRDQEWNIINSLYYLSSLYTTVGKLYHENLLFWNFQFTNGLGRLTVLPTYLPITFTNKSRHLLCGWAKLVDL